jgi:protein-tyrosine phosphatase
VEDFQHFDFIYAMDMSNYRDLLALAPDQEAEQKVKLILNELFPEENVEVPDPYYGGLNGFEQVYQMLDEACSIIANKLQS